MGANCGCVYREQDDSKKEGKKPDGKKPDDSKKDEKPPQGKDKKKPDDSRKEGKKPDGKKPDDSKKDEKPPQSKDEKKEPRNRFTCKLPALPYGTCTQRPQNYQKYASKDKGFDDLQDTARELVDKCKKLEQSEHCAFLRAWTANEIYKDVNKGLIEDDEGLLKTYGAFVAGVRRAIYSRLSKNVLSGTVYRYMTLNQQEIDQYKEGFKFLWPTITSTSKKDLDNEGNVLFKINLDGEGLTYAIDISDVSQYPDEEEVMIYPYSGFQVVKHSDLKGTSSRLDNIIDLKTIDTLIIESEK